MPQPRIPQNAPDPPPRPNASREATLVAAADSAGALLQYNTQGFIVNKRQRRMGGLAAIELAQSVQHLVSTCLTDVPSKPCMIMSPLH